MKPFWELDLRDVGGWVIFVDIDGTLTCEDSLDFSPAVEQKLEMLKKNSRILLCSNNRNRERGRKAAEILKVEFLDSDFRKPSGKLVSGLDFEGRKLLVIGDKFLTDGLFAKKIQADFIKVLRIKGAEDPMKARIYNFVDDLVYFFARLCGF